MDSKLPARVCSTRNRAHVLPSGSSGPVIYWLMACVVGDLTKAELLVTERFGNTAGRGKWCSILVMLMHLGRTIMG